jgi:sulfite reductase (ferredoxin)
MTTGTTPPATTPPTSARAAEAHDTKSPRRPRKRGEGQWGLGYFEPLNAAERAKRDDDGLNVRARIESTYARKGFRSIDKTDLRSRFRWWGLYTQRKQGIPGGATATVEPNELEDEFFMLRIRIPGGALTSDQLRAIAHCSERYGRDVADVTDRQNVQLHWIRIEDVPAIWACLETVGLSTQEACGDTPRVMIGCALAGVDADELIDATPVLLETERRFVGDERFSNLPRKYKTSISGCRQQCGHHEVNDVSFVGVQHPDLGPGFDLWVGGGLSTNPMLAHRLNAFVEPRLVPDVWAAVTATFRDYGYRRARNHARLKFLIADWGPERFREVLEEQFLGFALPDGPAPDPSEHAHRDHVGVHRQRDGRRYVGFAPRAGRIHGHQLRRVAELADRFGAARIRTTTQQKIVILDVDAASVADIVAELEAEDLRVNPSSFRAGMVACTGIEFCKLAIVETKGRAAWLARELEERIPDLDEQLRIHVNGCPNSCARFQLADIGLMGVVLARPDGTKSEAFFVHLGGGLGARGGFARKVKGTRVFAEDAADYVEALVRRYRQRRNDLPNFRAFVNALQDDELQAFARWDR